MLVSIGLQSRPLMGQRAETTAVRPERLICANREGSTNQPPDYATTCAELFRTRTWSAG